MKYYRRLCNSLTDYGRFIPAETSDYFNLYQYIDKLNEDWYLSIFVYDEKQVEHAQEYIEFEGKLRPRGISGITEVFTNKLVWDFDCESDIGASLTDTKEVLRRLTNKYKFPIDSIQLYFSGNKGFSVEIDTSKKMTPGEFKQIVVAIAGDLPTFDSKITNAARIFRIPYTKHPKSGLYKVPLLSSELDILNIEEIKTIGKDELEPAFPDSYKRISMPQEVITLLTPVKPKELTKIEYTLEGNELQIDWSKKPKHLSKWKYALLNGYFPSGSRSHALMILAATFHKLGLGKEALVGMLSGVAELQANRSNTEPFSTKEIENNIVKVVCSPLWQGGTYSEDNFPEEIKNYLIEMGIQKDFNSIDGSDLVTTEQLFGGFKTFAENIEANTIKTGIKELDKLVSLQVQMLVGLLGSPASGKTTIALEILRNTSLRGEQGMFFSLDMGNSLVYTKLASKITGYTPKEIYKLFVDKNEKEISRIREGINKNFANITISFKSSSSTADIRNAIIQQEQISGKKVRLVVIDYLESVAQTGSDPLASISKIGQELKDISNDLNVLVFLLLQPPKYAGDPSKPLESYTLIKGSSVISQAASVVITIHREGFNPKNPEMDKFITFNIVKNRMGQLGSVDMGWDGLRGEICQLAEDEKQELEELRKFKRDKDKIAEL